jgi:hypothetical protein
MGDDINYGELFGVEDTAQEPNEDAEKDTGAEEQEITDPADDSGTEKTDVIDQGKQSAEENAKYAAARRKAEADRDTAIAKAKEEAQKTIDEAIRGMGMYDPYTKKPITTKAEYDAYKQKIDIEKKSKVAKASGMSEDEFNSFVEDLPEVKAAKEMQAKAEEQLKAAQQAQAQVKINEQLAEITAMDPAVKTLEDLKAMENYEDFYKYVKRGSTLVEAYKLANFDKLTSDTAKGAKQAVINSLRSKSHLEKTSGRGAGAETVPSDIAEQYRIFNPGATDAEIQKHYNKYIKK